MEKFDEVGEVLSPSSQSLSTSKLSLCIQILLEFEDPIVEIDRVKNILVNAFIPMNPRFSSILENDEKGVMRWRKTTVNVDDHLFVPEFPPDHESYDSVVHEYISNLCLTPFDHSRPLWEFHILNYQTSKAQATLIIRVHHAIGDGISLMSILFSCVTRVDNPTLPPTFPASKKCNLINTKRFNCNDKFFMFKYFEKLWYVVLVLWYTMVDVMDCLLRMMGWMEDSKLPIRGPPGVENLPVAISSVEFPMVDIKQIRTCMGATVNEVLTGIIFSGIQRYLQICLSTGVDGGQHLREAYGKRSKRKDIVIKQMKNLRVTSLALINKRALSLQKNLKEMVHDNPEVIWGNHFGFLHLPLPLKSVESSLEFVETAKSIMERQKMSLGIFAIAKILGYFGRLKGAQVLAKYAYNTIASTTMAISNMVGPMEKIAIDDNILNRFSFFVSGAPQTLSVHILSYANTITLQVIAQKSYIDVDMLSNLLKEAFEEIKEASIKIA
ncbi:hypothetical protein KI387_035998 [Taxus chinensis]|uniref:Diacylglycerol O-acyltransferase n=1 Tax=Taxus chinensis TaxID=29808 RepID=A0AA38FP83_TAXCH|nr:hypothetical protein KI387_035998 [Taxus chinensis]